ncbi:mutator type transposase [Tanacetum coccineum]
MVKLSVDLNKPKDISKTHKAAQNGRTPKSLTLEIHHGGWFTPTPSRSYIGGHVSPVNVVDIYEFCLHDLKDMVVKLSYGVEDLMYRHGLIPSLGLDYGMHSLNVDADVLEMSKYVKDYKIILVYVEHGSSNVDTSMFDSTPDVNRNVKKEWEKVSSKSSNIGEVMKKLSKEQPASSVARSIVVESVVDPFDGLDKILANDFSFGKFKEVEVEVDTESEEEESDTEGNDTSGSDSEDLDYDPKHNDVFDDDEHIVEEVHVNKNSFSFTADPKHDTSIGVVDVQEDDLDVIDYDSFGSDLDDRIQLKELRRLGKQKNKGPNKYYFYLGQQFASKEIVKGRVKKHSVETRRQMGNHVIKSLATNPDIHVREVQDQMPKQFEVGVSNMKAFRAKRIASDIITGSPWPGQILTAVGVDANNEIYPVAYVIVEAESKASWCWFLNLLGEDLGIEVNFNYTFIYDMQKGLIQAIASVFPSAEHMYYAELNVMDMLKIDKNEAKRTKPEHEIGRVQENEAKGCMRTRSSSNLIVESSMILKRRNRRRSKQIVEPELRTIVETTVDTMADTHTMSELLQAPTKAAGGNLLNHTPRDALTIIENNSKVRTSRNKPIVSKVSTTTSSQSPSPDVTALTEMVKELVLMNKASQQASVKAQNPSGLGSLPSNTVANPRGDSKAITTRSGVSYDGPTIPPTPSPLPKEVERETEVTKDRVQTTSLESTAHVQPSVVQDPISEPEVAPKLNPKPSIPYPSRLNDQKLREKANNQMLKFL